MTAQQRFRIFLVGTEFFREQGGIQFVNRELLRVLAEFARETPTDVEVFSLNDPPGGLPAEYELPAGFQWRGFARRKVGMVLKLEQRLWRAQPHLVLFTHVHLAALAGLARLAARRARIGVLGHGVEVWKKLGVQIAYGLRLADAVVAPSEFTRAKMVEVNGVAPEHMTVIAHGLSAEWVNTFQRSARPKSTGCTLLSVTRLVRADTQKGVHVVLRAMPEILRRCPEARYVIVGDGNDRAALEQLAAKLGIAGRVEFRGELSNEGLCRAYQEADVFVLPSQQEGFGLVFLEAMYSGLPVVAARSGSAPNVVEDGVTGILVAPEDEKQIVSAVSGLLLMPEERRRMGAAGRKLVEDKYLFAHFAARWQRWMEEVAPEAVRAARDAGAVSTINEIRNTKLETREDQTQKI
ncbi:MAG: glycosyltransferase family 4 protein [Acidobacteria bacterium]|nr:glycosyltransferase family 4 protein [Acidobacteriota bacterium]MCL5287450.1 glycosyltransferase family 4 protein [Acidobacteriota bacterium]